MPKPVQGSGSSSVDDDSSSDGKSDLRDNSRLLDVHKWSDWSEVNSFIDDIHSSYFKDYEALSNIRKKHLKVLLLDLYVAWKEGWKYVGMSRDVDHYKPKSRYNALNISKTSILVADHLEALGLIKIHPGFRDPKTGIGYVSRLQPLDKLISRFIDARFPDVAISCDWNREPIELKDAEKNRIEYDDEPKTKLMRKVLNAYNELLKRTHVDCCHLAKPHINRKDGKLVRIGQFNKFTKRVFNDGSWKKGGRFYGGFWQQIPSDHRQFIRINGERTVEIDYSGLHIILLYAKKGLNYWTDVGGDDPYTVQLAGLSSEDGRKIGKHLLLMAINSKDEKSAFKALRSSINEQDVHLDSLVKLTDDLLSDALEQLKAKHPNISDKLCSGVGIDLQRTDSNISEALIKSFTADAIPLLAIHDSYIVPHQYTQRLIAEMEQAFVDHTDVAKKFSADVDDLAKRTVKIKQVGYDDEFLDELDLAPEANNSDVLQKHQEMVDFINGHTHPNYWQRLKAFQKERVLLDKKDSGTAT